jgi:hypothetical protein
MNRKVVIANPRSGAQLDLEMQNIVREFQPEVLSRPMPLDIERFFEFRLVEVTGVNSAYRELPLGVDGYTDSDVMESVVSSELIDTDDLVTRRRGRSTIAHECVHAIVHVPEFRAKKARLRSLHEKKNDNLRFFRQEQVETYMNPEWQAWRGAKGLLMPISSVFQAVNKGHRLTELAEIYDVNPAFVKSRVKELGLLEKIKTF